MPWSTCCFAVTWSLLQNFHGFDGQTRLGLLVYKSAVYHMGDQESLWEHIPAARQGCIWDHVTGTNEVFKHTGIMCNGRWAHQIASCT